MERIEREGVGGFSPASNQPVAKRSRDIVVIGVAPEGINALCKLLELLPESFPAAVLVALQAESCSTSMLMPRIRQHSKRPVAYARDGEAVCTRQVYLSSPDRHLVVRESGVFGLDDGPKRLGSRPAADCLFESAAHVFGPRVIGILLNDVESEGSAGLRAIKAAGGLGIVQHPTAPQATVMPLNTVGGDSPDFCVKLNVMGALLCELVLRVC